MKWKASGRALPDGVNAKVLSHHGPLAARPVEHIQDGAAMKYKRPLHD